jgi:two-component system, sporulation sensor kinase E
MPEGGQLKISTDLSIEDKTVKIKFSDSGAGIPMERLSRLQEPFFTTKTKGIGLGLPIAYEIVERHKGKIDVDSELGKGTTFTINLPLERK